MALLLAGRVVRHELLVGPDGAWRQELWLDDLLEADDAGIEAAPGQIARAGPVPAAMGDAGSGGPPPGRARSAVADTVRGTARARTAPGRNPGRSGRQTVTADHPLAINTCPADSLQFLPGVGPVLAARIDEARRAGTVFRTPADLMAIRGIGPAAAARLAPLVRFATSAPKTVHPDNPH